MTLLATMKQALEAFEDISSWYDYEQSVGELASNMYEASCLAKSKANELRQAIAELESQEPEAAPVAKNEGGKITWMIDDWPQNCLLYTHPPKSFTYEQVKAHIRAASMSANDIVVGSDVTNHGVSVVIRRRDEILYAEFFAHPPQRTEQEPVAWMDADGNVSDNNDHKCFPIPLYTHPPQEQQSCDKRTWAGLTEGDMLDAFTLAEKATVMRPLMLGIFARAIEAKLKEKNT